MAMQRTAKYGEDLPILGKRWNYARMCNLCQYSLTSPPPTHTCHCICLTAASNDRQLMLDCIIQVLSMLLISKPILL